MTLLREIQEQASSGNTRVADLLRKCLILAARLKSDELGAWVDQELNGYSNVDNLPEYRIKNNVSIKGNFSGFGGSSVSNYPIPPAIFPKELREKAVAVDIVQGVAALEDLLNDKDAMEFQLPFADDFTNYMSNRIMQNYHCYYLWHSLPRGAVIGLLDAVKTKVLGFALDIEKQNPAAGEADVSDKSGPVPPAAVQQAFNQHFYGSVGNVAAGSQDFQQEATLNQQSLNVDLPQLARELPVLRQALVAEASEPEHYAAIGTVRAAELEAEKKDTPKLLQSLAKAGPWVLEVATKIGTSVAAEAIKKSMEGSA